jgi:hypothetical protein
MEGRIRPAILFFPSPVPLGTNHEIDAMSRLTHPSEVSLLVLHGGR